MRELKIPGVDRATAASTPGLVPRITNTMVSQGELPAGWRPRMLSMPMNAAVVLQDFGFLRAAELAGLKGLGLSPAGADFDSQVGQSVER